MGLATTGERTLNLVPASEDGDDAENWGNRPELVGRKSTGASTPLPNHTKSSLGILANKFLPSVPSVPRQAGKEGSIVSVRIYGVILGWG